MNKIPLKIRQEVNNRSEGLCELTGSNYMVEQHHIVRRKHKAHNKENIINLCYYKHRGTNGVHGKNGHALDFDLKRGLQKYYEAEGRSEEEIYSLMGDKFYDTGQAFKFEEVETHFQNLWSKYHGGEIPNGLL